MAIIESYSISDVSLQVECEDNRLAKRIIGAIDDYLFGIWGSYQACLEYSRREGGVLENHMTKNGSVSNSHTITLRFKNNNFSIKVPETAQELSISSSLRVLKDGDFCYLISGDSIIQLDLKNSTGTGSLDSNFWRSSLKCKQDFLMLSLLWLLRPYGLYALHANGLVKDNMGVLIVGGSGSGKSTTALSLIRQGWGYLSDDVTLIRYTLDGIEAIAFLKGFSFDPNLANHYSELNKPVVSPVELPLEVPHLNGHRFDPSTSSGLTTGKRFLDISRIYPDRLTFSCFPKVLIFPEIVSSDKSKLIPIDRTKALILLAKNSGGIMVDKEMVVKQMEVLKKLVYKASSYHLLAGHDLYEEPERISEILNIFSH